MLMYASSHSNTPTIMGRVLHGVATEGFTALPGKMSRLAHKLWRQATFQPYTVSRRFAGEELCLLITDIWAEDWYVTSGCSSYEALWLNEHLHEGDLFIDCGPHHGLFSILGARWVGETGKVIAIEALPQNVITINKNLVLNEVVNAEVLNVAASSGAGSVFVEQENFGVLRISNGTIRQEPHAGTIRIPSLTIDEIVKGRIPSMLKIDVEGHEVEVLKGAQQTLAHKPSLDLEIHVQLWDSPVTMIDQLFALLPIRNYKGMIEFHSPSNIEPFDPLVHTPEWIATCSKANLYLTPIL